jgi:uncharacterized protein involved in exopolysaccharide biosynthesis
MKELKKEENLQELFPLDILVLFSKNIRLFIIVPFIIFILSTIYIIFIVEPKFISQSKIISSGAANNRLSEVSGLAMQFGLSIPNSKSNNQWVYEDIIKSRSLIKSMLYNSYNYDGNKYRLIDIVIPESINNDLPKNMNEYIAVDNVLNMIQVDQDLATKVFTIRTTSSNPEFSKTLNESLIKALDERQKNYNLKKSSETRIFIESRIKKTQKELMNLEEKLKVFRDRNRRIQGSPALLLEEERIARDVLVLTGVFTSLKQQLETAKIDEVKESEYVIVIDSPDIPISPSSPQTFKFLLLTLIFSLFFVAALIMLKDYLLKLYKVDFHKINLIKKNLSILLHLSFFK